MPLGMWALLILLVGTIHLCHLVVAHVACHSIAKAAQLKEEAYVARYLGDIFYPFALEASGPLHPIFECCL